MVLGITPNTKFVYSLKGPLRGSFFCIAYRGGAGGASADYAFLYFPGVIPLYFLNVLIK